MNLYGLGHNRLEYRYLLTRDLGSGVGSCNFIMLNPSTATEIEDDPTIRRCKGFVRDWGYRYLIVTNLSPRRTPSPRRLRAYGLERLEIHERNVSVLEHHATHSNLVVAAWGFHGSIHRLGDAGRLALRRVSRPVYCLGKVKSGDPRQSVVRRSRRPSCDI